MQNNKPYIDLVNEIMNKAKDKLGYKTDADLANEIETCRSGKNIAISNYRKGSRVINSWKLLRLVKIADMDRLETYKRMLDCNVFKKESEEVIIDIIDQLKYSRSIIDQEN